MTEHFSCEIAVIGAGVIGLTTALALARDGRDVVLVDPNMPGSGASYGNAGTIADYAVLPVGSPEVLKNLPALLFDPNSPLSVLRPAIPSLVPWLARFLRQSLPAAARRNAAALAPLVAGATPGWIELAASVGAADILHHRGCLYLHETAKAARAAAVDAGVRQGLGVGCDVIDGAALATLEPGLGGFAGATFFPDAVFLDDPGRMMLHLASAVEAARVPHLAVRVRHLERLFDGVALYGGSIRVHAKRVVVAAGAHSRGLALQAGDRVPLETERGYHVEWDLAGPRLSRPACPTSRGFYLCPMAGRLRVAGTVELGGLAAPPSPHRIAGLVDGARRVFPDLGAPSRDWMGFRPSLPDSLPVIGPSRGGAEVIHAFGHGHIGLTLAPITARIVTDLVAGRTPEIDLAPYRATRF